MHLTISEFNNNHNKINLSCNFRTNEEHVNCCDQCMYGTSDGFYDTFKEFHKLYTPHWSLGEVFELFLCHVCKVNNVTDVADVDFFHATNNEMFTYLESFIDKIKNTTHTQKIGIKR